MSQITQNVLKDLATKRGVSDLELKVLRLALEGQSVGVIAEKLGIAESTVWTRLGNVYRKFDIKGSGPGKFVTLKRTLEEQYQAHPKEVTAPHQGRSPIPDVPVFYGRTEELNQLEQWLLKDGCQLVALLGIGGIGKTTLSAKLTEQVKGQFEQVIWRSLRDAPRVEDLLEDLPRGLSKQETDLPKSVGDKISRLIKYLQQHRCLIVLDNAESIFLENGELAGVYKEGYQDYGELLRAVGEISHQSCLVITSREKPQEVALLEEKTPLVKSLELTGLDYTAAQELFEKVGGFALGDEKEWKKLINLYGGNPLALKIISSTIQDLYGGNISKFLEEQGEPVFLGGGLRELLSQPFGRLSELEKEIMYWLATNRTPVSVLELQSDIISTVSKSEFQEALESLKWRSLIEKSELKASGLTLHPVVMEYITEQLVQDICREIRDYKNNKIKLFNRCALIKAQAHDYNKESQVCFILQPIIENLLTIFGDKESIENKLKDILSTLPKQSPPQPGYAGGNIINLLSKLKNEVIDEWDFSEIAVWQADLEGVKLHNVNFAYADLAKSTFAETLSSILSVAFHSNGKWLAIGEVNGKVRLWNVADGKSLWICGDKEKHDSWVQSVAFSPDGKILASSSGDQTVKLWNVDMDTGKGEYLKSLEEKNTGPVRSVAFSSDGAILASGSDDGIVRLWNVDNWQCFRTLGEREDEHKGWVWSVAFSPDEKILASGSDDCTAKLWDVRTGSCLHTLKEHKGCVSSVAFSPTNKNENILASSSADQTIRLWDVRTGQNLWTSDKEKEHSKWVWSVAFSPDGKKLASSSDDHKIKLWDVDTRECIATFEGHTDRIGTVAFSPDSKILASGSVDQTVKFWEIGTQKCLNTLKGYTNKVEAVAFSPHRVLLASSSDDKTVKLWNVDTGKDIKTLEGHESLVRSVAFSPDGKILASGSNDCTVKLWEVGTWQCLRTLRGHENLVSSVAFSPDGKILASGSDDYTVKLWNVNTGKLNRTLRYEHNNRIQSVAFAPQRNANSPDAKRLLASGSDDKKVTLWNADTGECIKPQTGDNWVWSVAFSPDEKFLASGNSNNEVQLWDVDTMEPIKTPLKAHASCGEHVTKVHPHPLTPSPIKGEGELLPSRVTSVAFTPDGKILAGGSDDRKVWLWDVDTKELIKPLEGHTSRVTSVAFSPDGKTLASGSDDETIRLWNVQTREFWKILTSKKLYEGTDITGVIGLTNAQKTTLKELGAIEQ